MKGTNTSAATATRAIAAAGERRRVGIVPHKLKSRLYRADDPLDSLDDTAKVELLERLDQASLQAQRKLTIPFLKETLGW